MSTTTTIPVPTWLLQDEEIRTLLDRLREVRGEVGPDERDEPVIDGLERELIKRGSPVHLRPDGTFGQGARQ